MLSIFLSVCTLLSLVSCDEDHDPSKNILVLIENVWIKDTHSTFLKMLTERGFSTTIRVADDSGLTLTKYGEYMYKHVILLSPSVSEFGGQISVKTLVKFLDDGGNLIVTAGNDVGEAIRQLGSECGVEFDDSGTSVIDHHSYDAKDDGTHTLLVVPEVNLLNDSVITGGKLRNPFVYHGIGISADPNNPLLINVLHADHTSYSYSVDKPLSDYPNTVGTNTQLIVALQARNNARAIFIGSLDFLSNDFFAWSPEKVHSKEKFASSGNLDLVKNLLPWVLGERGQLRVASVKHHRVGETTAPSQYTILDDVYFGITIETKNEQGRWVPYDADDVQLEFVRIDPFIRRTLQHKGGSYQTVLKLPDVYGVFKFVVDYHRLGYTHLSSVSLAPVRPFTHTQYERFIVAAYPYYFSAISMVVGVILFSFVFLYFKDDKEKVE